MLWKGVKRQMSAVYIVAGRRTAMGGFQSKLSKFRAGELGAFAISGAIKDVNGLNKEDIDEVIMGTVC
jgi:acetyl-CoA C-acetyltransferase